MANSIESMVAEFLGIADQFKLGSLPTEKSHPLTHNLSTLAKEDLKAGFRTLQSVDHEALLALKRYTGGIVELGMAVANTLQAGGRVFLAGCGATGRLALTLETLAREGHLGPELVEKVFGFMAGGDSALIRSLEGFEDYPEYGARQLAELGFRDSDLMVGITEGGETPFVIGATEAALTLGQREPWFCYCNPAEVLCEVAERSRRVLGNEKIHKLELFVGPMALAGSTRMQATTVQLLGVGLALQCGSDKPAIEGKLSRLLEWLTTVDYAVMSPLTVAECDAYANQAHVLYETDAFGMTVLTDTTERAPTFSLSPFENEQDASAPLSLCYLRLPAFADAEAAWRGLLEREPRCLEWQGVQAAAGRARLMGFDISQNAESKRERRWAHPALTVQIGAGTDLQIKAGSESIVISVPSDALLQNICLKVLLNAHSTLLMGRMGRYEGNLMTWVKPSNNKLIDRSIRYVQELYFREHGIRPEYALVCEAVFRARENLAPDEPIVLKALALL